MAYDREHKTAEELQREIEMQRDKVESTIDEIQAKLSPGQLVDELLAYTKGGGGEFVSTLQRQVTANPLPVALLGVSLAWLMAKPRENASTSDSDRAWDESINRHRGYRVDDEDENGDYPVTIITGSSLQRKTRASDALGRSVTEFADEAGRTFKALTDQSGRRAGHFVDETGARFKGFTTATGEQVQQFRDEAGNILEGASDWASHTWQKAREKLRDLGSTASAGRAGAQEAAGAAKGQLDSLNQSILNQFKDQPLVGGALAFALGAALGSALPHTPQEDALLGDAADAVKAKAGEIASDAYEQGKEKAAEVYDRASEKAADLYQEAKDGFSASIQNSPTNLTGPQSGG